MSQNETQNLPLAPHLTPADYIMQVPSSFYDAAYSLGKYLIAEGAETFELAADYTGRVLGPIGIALGYYQDGSNGAAKAAFELEGATEYENTVTPYYFPDFNLSD